MSIVNIKFFRIYLYLAITIFAFCFVQKPLYSSNQNTYFLHGLAAAGVGHLQQDWLANTEDPFPVFSALISATIRFASPEIVYVYQIIIQWLYVFALWKLGSTVFEFREHKAKHICFLFLLAAIHFSGVDSAFTDGVAKQYILGPMFQPSVFGIFLILSICAFLRDREFIAIGCLALASTFHTSYLLSSAALTAAYMLPSIRTGHYSKAAALGALALVLVTPVIAYNYLHFRPSNDVVFARAQDILINDRIPHHAVIKKWLNGSAIWKTTLIVISLIAARRTKLFPILTICFLCSLTLTVVQGLTGNKSLALLFPWRMSAFLVPIAATVALASIVNYAFKKLASHELAARKQKYVDTLAEFSKWPNGIGFIVPAALFIFLIAAFGWSARNTLTLFESERNGASELTDFVAGNYRTGDLYLVPTALDSFRIAAGVPIFVDRKSHPYKDTELIEWFNRLNMADKFYASADASACAALANIVKNYRITHIVADSSRKPCAQLTKIFQTEKLSVYSIQPANFP